MGYIVAWGKGAVKRIVAFGYRAVAEQGHNPPSLFFLNQRQIYAVVSLKIIQTRQNQNILSPGLSHIG